MSTRPPIPDWVNSGTRRESRRAASREIQVRRRRAAAVLGGLAIIVLLAAVTSGGGGPRVVAPAPAAKATARGPALTEPIVVREHRREERAIDRVLASGTLSIDSGGHQLREVALTFDDGPSPYTSQVLGVLQRYKAPATFFAVGEQEHSFSDGTRAALQAGYWVEDHTSTHPFLTHLSPADQHSEILGAAQTITGQGATFPRLFRPPYGAFDRATLAEVKRLRLLSVLWTIDTEDYRQPGSATIAHTVLSQAAPGAIVLMHDGGGPRQQTVDALPEIIRGLRARGYQLVSVPRMMLDDPPAPGQRVSPGFGSSGG